MSGRRIAAATIQMSSTPEKAENFETADGLVRRAVSAGAELVALPELWSCHGLEEVYEENAEPVPGPTTEFLGGLARELGVCVLGGSILESRPVAPGREIVTAQAGATTLGLSVCYDLRFPELYRLLALEGAEVLAVPAAFTLQTGKDHWELLLRARAVENQAFVLAPAQWGQKADGRWTYGRSMIVDPWGTVLTTCPDRDGHALATLDLYYLDRIRAEFPALANRRPEAYDW